MKKKSCYLLGFFWVLLLCPQPVSAEEMSDSRSVNIQVDRLEGGPESRSNSLTNNSGLFYLEDTQLLQERKEEQQAEKKHQSNQLFTKPTQDTTHDTLKKIKIFTAQTTTSSSTKAAAEAHAQSLALASLTENTWFGLVIILVLLAAVLASYQLYKRDKNAGY